jgi:hypothetical protein
MVKQVHISILILLLFFAFPSGGISIAAQDNVPPIIDREIFFGNPEITGARISPNGKFIAFRKPFRGTMNIWVKGADEPFDRARILTNLCFSPVLQLHTTVENRVHRL